MSRTPEEPANRDVGIGDEQHTPHSAPLQTPPRVSNFVDGSGPIFSLYLEMATEEDKKMAEKWKADADGILIFTGLFSAAVASLISVSIQDIRPNPQDISNFYLANIYQTVSDPNISTSLPTSPPPFSPPNYAVWVNALCNGHEDISGSLSPVTAHTSEHESVRSSPEGVEKLLLPWTVETLPALLHISLFLFFAGLGVFLCNVHTTISKLVVSWVGVCATLYGCITFLPIFRHDSPYYTSLSSLVWLIVFGIAFVGSQVRWWFHLSVLHRRPIFRRSWGRYYGLLSQGMQRTAEATALKSRSEIDARAFMWTFDFLDEDHEMERFFAGLPGFCNSKMVKNPLLSLSFEQVWKLSAGLKGLLDRTFASDLLPAPVKQRRALICAKAVDPAHTPMAFSILDIILSNDQNSGPLATRILQIVRGWRNNTDEDTILVTQATISSIVARARRRDDSWFILASNELAVPESVLRGYATHGDSLSLAVLIHITRQQFNFFWKRSWVQHAFAKVLEAASAFDVQNTSPELQHEFCALWNQIVHKARNDDNETTTWVALRPIRDVYIALHQDTDSTSPRLSASRGYGDYILWQPSSYPACNVSGHIRDDTHSATFVRAVGLVPGSLASPDVPSSPVPSPLHVDKGLMEELPLDISHPAHQTTIKNLRIPVTSPDPAAAREILDIVTSVITMPNSTPETQILAPSLSSISLPSAFSLQHNADLLTPSDAPNLLSSASSNVVLDHTFPTDPPLSSHPHITRSDLSSSSPESISSFDNSY
ncbi:hypothetical protein EDB87DRAFT_1763480 [Lactarius vividus]|nr:hypothetical protein EDB87DRAFT_1763480 [Lactarius vividus]